VVLVALAMVLGPLLGVTLWGAAFTAVFAGLGLDAPCAFDPPPGDQFLIALVKRHRLSGRG
jgi:hypothetical protein